MWCTTCCHLSPRIIERLSALVGIVTLPCSCYLSKKKEQPADDEDRFEKREPPSPCLSTSTLNLPFEGALEEEHPVLCYFPSEEHLSFYDDTECEEIKSPFGVAPMSNVAERPDDVGVRNAVLLDDERSVNTTPLSSIPALTHDTRRAKYHMSELNSFADRLEQSALRAFPNRGRNRYKQVIAVLIQWGDDSSHSSPEIDRMRTLFEASYGFYTQLWLIPSSGSHLKLISLVLHFLEDYGSSDNLMVVYYGGHGVINSVGQTTWLAERESLHPSLDWSAIQNLFEETESDVLFLLDCCAAVGTMSGGGQGITETIAASGVEPWPPGPGRNLFTNALISVLEDWVSRPSFTAAMLHSEVLSSIKHEKPERRKWTDMPQIQDRKTPIYILNSDTSIALSIELAARRPVQSRTSANFSRPALAPSPLNPSPVFTKYDIYNPSNLLQTSKLGELQIPHVLISVALEEDCKTDVKAWRQWVLEIPALANYAVVEAVYKSYPTMLLISIPLLIWNMLPDDLAVSFVAYVQSRNLLATEPVTNLGKPVSPNSRERTIEPSRRPLHKYSKSYGGATENQMDEMMRTVKTTLESATLVRITNLSDLPRSPKSPKNLTSSRNSVNTPVSPLRPISLANTFGPKKTIMDRPSTSRGPDTNRDANRLDSPRVSSDFAPNVGTSGRPLTSNGSGSDRVFESLNAPLQIKPPITGQSEAFQTPEQPSTHRPSGRRHGPLHSNPVPLELRVKTSLQTARYANRQSTGADNRDPFVSDRFGKDEENKTKEKRAEQPQRPAQEPAQNIETNLNEQPPGINHPIQNRLGGISSRRAAKLDAALSDIFAVESPDPHYSKKQRKRRSAGINAVSELEATEALISALQAEARFAREEARRAWDELGEREREERRRLASLKDGKSIWIGKYQVRVVNEKNPDLGSKAAAFLGTILSPREAMEKHRRARSEPRYSGKRPVDPRVKVTYPPIPPPKNTPPVPQDVTQQPPMHISQLKAPPKPVEVYQPKLPERSLQAENENKRVIAETAPSNSDQKGPKRPIPERKSSRQHITEPQHHPPLSKTATAFANPYFECDHSFPDADPNVMRYLMDFEENNPSPQKIRTYEPPIRHREQGSREAKSKAWGAVPSDTHRGSIDEERRRGRSETAYTFFNDEDLLDRELRGRDMPPVVAEVKAKRGSSKLAKKRFLSKDRDVPRDKGKGKERAGSVDIGRGRGGMGIMERGLRVRV